MNIHLHIERLVLDGVSLEPHQRAELKMAVVTELGRLLTSNGIGSGVQLSNGVRSVQGGLIAIDMHRKPCVLGQQIAQSVYGGIADE